MATKGKAKARTYRERKGTPGRPRAPIDWAKVANLCAAGCYGGSIAHELGIAVDTLYLRCQTDNGEEFTAFRLRHLDRGNDILRKKQFDMAKGGNERLLIWLGKNRLGQKDKTEITGNTGATLPVINVIVQPLSDGTNNG
jgi:hypothetical protein